MRAIDTNIVVRLIARDDERQLELAKALLDEPAIVLPSVVLETVWVLATSYAMGREAIVDELTALLANPNMLLTSPLAIRSALTAYRSGGQLPDHLHVALASEVGADVFATFDRKVVNHAATDVIINVLR